MQESRTTPMESILGTIIERRYLLRDAIGEGGFAEVFEASDTKLGRRVALKILKPHPKPSQRELAHKRFFREAKLAAQISHPDVVTIFDYGQTLDDRPFIVLEHLKGRPLSRLLWHDGPMQPVRAYTLFMKVVHAIAAAHEQGVIHRDLKPSNLMIVNEGTRIESMKVLDFGIAFFFEEELTRLTSTGQFLGTPEYLAPEYIGEREITPALDVYQLALIFIEMLTGRPLVAFSEPLQCMFAHYNGHAKVPNYLKNSPAGNVLERALSTTPTQRFHNAGALFEALDAIDPLTIPTIPDQTTPEELGITRNWESAEVEQFSQAFEQKLALLSHHERTASIDPTPETPHRPHHPTEHKEDVHIHAPMQVSTRTLRLIGLAGLVTLLAIGATAFWIDTQGEDAPLTPVVTTSRETPPQPQDTAPVEPASHEVLIVATPGGATITEGDEVLGTGSVGVILSRDTPDIRRLTISASGHDAHVQEISRDSPTRLDVELVAHTPREVVGITTPTPKPVRTKPVVNKTKSLPTKATPPKQDEPATDDEPNSPPPKAPPKDKVVFERFDSPR